MQNDLSMHLSIFQLLRLTGRDGRTIAKQLSDFPYTAGERGAMLYGSAEALPLVYGVDNLEAARAQEARSAAQLNAIRAEYRSSRAHLTLNHLIRRFDFVSDVTASQSS